MRVQIGRAMVPAGYMAKKIAAQPDWLKAEAVADIYVQRLIASRAEA
jgi:hypothetical protein